MAGVAEPLASGDSLASVMNRLAPGLLMVVALVAFDGIDAAPSEDDAVFAPPSEIRFSGAVLVPAGSHAVADVHSASSLSPGRIIRRGSADSGRHDPLRTVVVLPPRQSGVRVVLITYD